MGHQVSQVRVLLQQQNLESDPGRQAAGLTCTLNHTKPDRFHVKFTTVPSLPIRSRTHLQGSM